MGREVRRVPKDWQHPKDERGRYVPMYPGSWYADRVREWEDAVRERGLQGAIDWTGGPPSRGRYMPMWTDAEADHLMMYEDTSEGTPISPPFKTPEELARWLADNNASAFGGMTATYEQWLGTAKRGWAPSMVISGGVMESGVAAPPVEKEGGP